MKAFVEAFVEATSMKASFRDFHFMEASKFYMKAFVEAVEASTEAVEASTEALMNVRARHY